MSDGNASFVGLLGSGAVDGRNGVAENLRQFDQDAIIDLDGRTLGDVLHLICPVLKLFSQKLDLFRVFFLQVIPDDLVVAVIFELVAMTVPFEVFFEFT